jgi:hypothetical protein
MFLLELKPGTYTGGAHKEKKLVIFRRNQIDASKEKQAGSIFGGKSVLKLASLKFLLMQLFQQYMLPLEQMDF